MKKIIAYCLHEDEFSVVSPLIKNAKYTGSYIMGDAEENDIEMLKQQGIVVKYLSKENNLPINTDDNFNIRSVLKIKTGLEGFNMNTMAANIPDLQPGFVPEFPAYFTISINSPLLDEYNAQLQQMGIMLNRYLGEDTYVAMLNQGDPERVEALEFVDDVEYYGSVKTLIQTTPKLAGEEMQESTLKTSFYDLILQSKQGLSELLAWLETNGYRVIGHSDLKVRILINPALNNNLERIASNKQVQSIEKYIPPKINNEIARELLHIDGINGTAATIGTLLEFEGTNQLIGVADTGIDDTHPDFAGQLSGAVSLGRQGNTTDPAGHGTHVTGSIVGIGAASNGKIKGVAPKAKVFFQSLLMDNGRLNIPIDLRDLFQQAYDAGVRIHNNSWGAATKSRYTANSNEVDDFVYSHPDMLLIFSAGNDGRGNNNRNVATGYTDLLSLGSPATAKNALTVGASRNKRTKGGYSRLTYGKVWSQSFPFDPTLSATVSGDNDSMAAFSSRGPVDDAWRIKPDLVAPGTDIASPLSKDADLSDFCGIHPEFDQYALLCGTSMSAPLVTGCAALVNEYYNTIRQHKPSAALLKATLINSCRLLPGQDGTLNNTNTPHFHQGFGIVDMVNCIPNKTQSFNLLYKDSYNDPTFRIEQNGQKLKFGIDLSTKSWLRVCLTYTDFPGRGIQNNLLLFADNKAKGIKWIGNDFIPRLLNVIEPTYNVSVDLNNNVQSIQIKEAEAGSYTVQVIAHNAWKLPQDYALVVTTNDMNAQLNHLNFI